MKTDAEHYARYTDRWRGWAVSTPRHGHVGSVLGYSSDAPGQQLSPTPTTGGVSVFFERRSGPFYRVDGDRDGRWAGWWPASILRKAK